MLDEKDIARIIEESFRDGTPPALDDIFDLSYDPRKPLFLDMIRGKDWKGFLHVLETSDNVLAETYWETFPLMTLRAFHYFTPALLIFAMNEDSDTLPQVISHVFFPQCLYHDVPETIQQRRQERLDLFSGAQKRAVAIAIHYYWASEPSEFQPAGLMDYCAEWL